MRIPKNGWYKAVRAMTDSQCSLLWDGEAVSNTEGVAIQLI